MHSDLKWWQKTTIYQIYPRSFKDSTGDGIGDLRGVISKLDYIQDLGFETIWLSPFFSSPQKDWGYDVSDYFNIAPEYGTLADAEDLIAEIHQRGMRVIFDLVMNHTSEEHPWFRDSRSSRDHPKRDWYLWRAGGQDGQPPNNWKAIPGGPGWHKDGSTGEWYFASFLPFQPDLNYRNPEVKAAMFEVARYWLNKGVDGFRLDMFHSLYKDEAFRNNPFSIHYVPHHGEAGFFQRWKYNLNLPETRELARELRRFVEEVHPSPMLLGEVFGDDETLKGYLGDDLQGLNLIFLWDLLNVKAKADFFRRVIRHYEEGYPPPYTPVIVFGNHDQRRVLSRLGGDERLAKLLVLFQFTARGVPVTYYGEEIGMLDADLPPKNALDPIGRRYAWAPQLLLDALNVYVNRDGCRTPMQWDGSRHAGFSATEGDTWLPVGSNYTHANVAQQRAEPDSILNTTRSLLRLRREYTALQAGRMELIKDPQGSRDLLAYRRVYQGEQVLVLINFGERPASFLNPSASGRILLTVGMTVPDQYHEIQMPPYAGLVWGSV